MSEPFDARLLLEHAEFLRALARSLVGDAALADDVVQETFAVALERPPAPGNLRAWLATVAKSIAFGERRAAGRRQRRERAAARAEPVASVAETAARLDVQKRLVHAVGDLEEPLRSTVVARFYDQLSFEQIAARDGVSVKTVSRRLDAALERLRGRLDAQHGGNRGAWTTLLLPLCGKKRRVAWAAAAVSLVWHLRRSAALLLVCAGVALTALTLWVATREGGSTRLAAGAPAADGAVADRSMPAEVAAPAQFRVRVLRYEDREPLGGIPVRVLRQGTEVEATETDAEGMAKLSVAGPGDGLHVGGQGFVPVERDVPKQPNTIEVELEPGLPLSVRVVCADSGASPAGAVAHVREFWNWGRGFDLEVEGASFSAVVPTDRALSLTAFAPGYAREKVRVMRAPGGVTEAAGGMPSRDVLAIKGPDEIELTLGKGLTLKGQVVNESGEQARRADVQWWPAERQYGQGLSTQGYQWVVTDESGMFTLRGMRPGAYHIVARSGNEAACERVTLDASLENLQMKMSRRPCLRIFPVGASGNALECWMARAKGERDVYEVWYRRKPRDPVELLLPHPGEFAVRVTGVGWEHETKVEAREGYQDIHLKIDEGATLEGVVTDEAGNAIPGMVVAFVPQGGEAYTDAEGRFVIRGIQIPKGDLIVSEANEPLGDWMEERIHDVAVGGGPIDIRLRRGPCAILRLKARAARLTYQIMEGSRIFPPPLRQVSRSPDGAFRIRVEPRRQSRVVVTVTGHSPINVSVPPLEVGESFDLGEFSPEPGFAVTGVVRVRGKPVAGALVGLDVAERCEHTDPEGEFRFEGIMASEAKIAIEGRGVMPLYAPVTLRPDARLTFDLEEAAHVDVHFVDAQGGNVFPGGEMVAVPLDETGAEDRERAVPLQAGRETSPMPLGTYRLYHTDRDGTERMGPCVTAERAGESIDVLFKLDGR